jgi:hypothetical protein
MGALIAIFAPEVIVLSVASLVVLLFLLLHVRSLVRNTVGAAALLFAWAVRAGFIGFVAYIAAWIFMFPVMVALCGTAGLARTWLEARARREARRQRRRQAKLLHVRQTCP